MSDLVEELLLNKSMQDVGIRILEGELAKAVKSTEIRYVGSDFALLATEFEESKALIFCKTEMYPADYEQALDKYLPKLKRIIKYRETEFFDGKYTDIDIYVVGMGLVQKYVETEEEKGSFRIGGKYAGAIGRIRLLSKAAINSLGYSPDNPFPVDDIACEYAMLQNIMADTGLVISKKRIGSYAGPEGHPVDRWNLEVLGHDGNLRFSYDIYLDPYAEVEESGLIKFPQGEIGFWKVPEGFSSFWLNPDREED